MKCKLCDDEAIFEVWTLACPAHCTGYYCEKCYKFYKKVKIIALIIIVLIGILPAIFIK